MAGGSYAQRLAALCFFILFSDPAWKRFKWCWQNENGGGEVTHKDWLHSAFLYCFPIQPGNVSNGAGRMKMAGGSYAQRLAALCFLALFPV